MNQLELEQEMVDGGRERMLSMLRNNEDKGKAFNNPYAPVVYRRFIQPLADSISTYVTTIKRGVHGGAKTLLRPHDPLALAFITVRACLAGAIDGQGLSSLSATIGRQVYGETLLAAVEHIEPALYYTVINDLQKRRSEDDTYRIAAFRQAAKDIGTPLPDWSTEERMQVGSLLVGIAVESGLVELHLEKSLRKTKQIVMLSSEVQALIDNISDFVVGASPITLPFVEPPRPWTSPNTGGYHSEAMQRAAPCVMRGVSSVPVGDIPPLVLHAVNTLQATPWQVNVEVLNTVSQVAKYFDVGEVVAQADCPKPPKPLWLYDDTDMQNITPVQAAEMRAWKQEMRLWYVNSKARARQWGRYYEALRIARKFQNEKCIYFLHQIDYRTRLYAITRGINPQGSDLQKALIKAAHGKPIGDAGLPWFKAAGANRYGYDKCSIADQIKWVDDNHGTFIKIANDPLGCRDWCEASSPFQFLAWCFEYAGFAQHGTKFISHLPLGQDGSCNGLQHFSAMLRDEVGGAATNLVPNDKPQDIYRLVAEETSRIVAADTRVDEAGVAVLWKNHTMTRELVKRAVMTLPYGSTRFSCSEFILKEYLNQGHAPEFSRHQYGLAANWLSYRVWEAIGRVVIKAREAMTWLQQGADHAMRGGSTELVWKAPNGATIRQQYPKIETVRVSTRLLGGLRLSPRVGKVTDAPDPRRHRNGIAPNFVHACDASHLQYLVQAATSEGISFLAMVHDDYGALACDVPKLHKLIRDTFVDMYQQNNPLVNIKHALGIEKDLPEQGTLNITEVRDSTYFFR